MDIIRNVIVIAASNSYEPEIEFLLLKRDVDINWINNNNRLLLQLAAYKGYDNVVYHLLQRPDIKTDTTDESGRTPLAMAAFKGYKDVVKYLLKYSINIKLKNKNNRIALSLTIY